MIRTLVGLRTVRAVDPVVRGATLLAALLALGACMDPVPPAEGPSSHIRVVQAVPNAPIVNLMVDSALALPGLSFRTATGFLRIAAGPRRIRLVSTSPATTLLDDTVHFEFPRAATVVATGLVGGVEAVIAPDTAPIPLQGEIAIRLLQASPAAGTVDLYVTDVITDIADATPVLEDIVFRGNSEYVAFPTGRYKIRLTAAGTKTVLFETTSFFSDRSMRTVVAFDATGGGLPVSGVLLVDF